MKPLLRSAFFLTGFFAGSLPVYVAVAADPSPYAGQQSREVKALSRQDLDDLMNGHGMGLAKAGELNGYPGPAHILDLASELRLSPDQIRQVGALKDRVIANAKPLGEEIIQRERELEYQFESATINENRLASETEAIGNLQGRLRAVHLAAHIDAKRVLTPAQIARYNELRGYSTVNSTVMHNDVAGHHGLNMDDSHCDNANPPRMHKMPVEELSTEAKQCSGGRAVSKGSSCSSFC